MSPMLDFVRALDVSIKRRAVAWIGLGVFALLAAGLLSLLLVVARTPVVSELLPGTDFFHVALVVHVDLSVLVWFMACAGVVWTVFGANAKSRAEPIAFALAVVGTAMIALAPFVGADQPLMNNYVPVLQHPWFFAGLGTLATGMVLQASAYLRSWMRHVDADREIEVVRFALVVAAITTQIAVACIAVSMLSIPSDIRGEQYFEVLFWGGGHVLQFTNTVLVLIAWYLLVRASGSRIKLSRRFGNSLFALVALPLVAVPFIYAAGVTTEAGIGGFTMLMRWGGLAALPLGVVILVALFDGGARLEGAEPLRATLLCSLTLFAAGGALGFLIEGANTVIPAHYHGSIVAVTLAFMGIAYFLLPSLGHPITSSRMLSLQPYVFAGGQLLHISGLAISGGYGVQRKVAGADQVLEGLAQTFGMGIMGLGGLAAAVGGLMFLVIAIGALRNRPSHKLELATT